MNVSELVRKLNTTREDLMNKLPELGFDIGKKAIKVQDKLAEDIIRTWNIDLRKKREENEQMRQDAIKLETERIREAQQSSASQKEESEKVIELPERISIREFAKKLNYPVIDILSELMKNGIMSAMNEEIDYETAAIIAGDCGFETKKQTESNEKKVSEDVALLDSILRSTSLAHKKPRPPVIVVMGHVDHGKTKLLDAIRRTHLAELEAGGITQAIGAYQVKHKDRVLTFIDTPGHEAFTAMRSRGARVADMAILVVAADDGVQPQTKEALQIIKQAGLPFIVAMNKIDKEEADLDRLKKQLSDIQLVPEDWGGNTICVPISAKAQKNIDQLFEMILLVSDMHKEAMQANTERNAMGTIIDSRIDKGEGPLATVLIQTGTLKVGDYVLVCDIPGKVKAMKDFQGKFILEALPSTPVQILGLKAVPVVGDILQVLTDKKLIKKKMKKAQLRKVEASRSDFRQSESHIIQKQVVPLILRADTLGSLEAILGSFKKFQHAEIILKVVNKGLGNINEHDVIEASNSGALLIGFNVSVMPGAIEAQQKENIEIHTYKIIYDLLDKVKEEMGKRLSPEIVEVVKGKLKVLAIFREASTFRIIGARVEEGEVCPQHLVKIWRGAQNIGSGTISQLQVDKKNVGSVSSGKECGLKVDTRASIQVGDNMETIVKEKRQRAL